jgi:hypothetical protein
MVDRGIYTSGQANLFKARAGEKYRPSNGTEGDYFASSYCVHCKRSGPDEPCMIAGAVFFYDVKDESYPTEWQYGADGQPTCTAFEERA